MVSFILWFIGISLIISGNSGNAFIGICLLIAGGVVFWRKSATKAYLDSLKDRDEY